MSVQKHKDQKNMSTIKGSCNKSTELSMVSLFRVNKIKGWRRHSCRIFGTPDFVFSKNKVAIFVDGCFWHGCPKCWTYPKLVESIAILGT